MNEEQHINYSEQLSALLDGELGGEEQKLLFMELANNSELQLEMQELMALKSSFKNSLVTPPALLHNEILEKVSLDDASLVATSFFTAKFLRNALVLSVLLVSLTLGTLFMINGNQSNSEFAANEGANKERNIALVYSDELDSEQSYSSNASNLNDSQNQKSFAGIGKDRNASSYSNNSSSRNNSNANNAFIATNNDAEANKTRNYYNIDESEQFSASQFGIPDYNGMAITPKISNMRFARYLQNVSFSFRTYYMNSNPDFTLNNDVNPLLNNFALNIAYHTTENHSFGVEMGIEKYLLSYEGYGQGNDIESYYQFNQSYNGFWGGVFYQYMFDELESLRGLRPYSKLTLGATKIGPLARATAGAYYFVGSNTAINFGFEAANLTYQFQGSAFNTTKYGITTGLMISF